MKYSEKATWLTQLEEVKAEFVKPAINDASLN
jgi:hypothetical protein